jgi:hypothetical protein
MLNGDSTATTGGDAHPRLPDAYPLAAID